MCRKAQVLDAILLNRSFVWDECYLDLNRMLESFFLSLDSSQLSCNPAIKFSKQTTFATTAMRLVSTPGIPLTISLFLLATLYGKGVYFALNASYSERSTYSPPDVNGCRYMYLTRVLVGEYIVGRQGLLTPPARNAGGDPPLADTYDSVVDQNPNPQIFVVFYDWQCYPEYLITFH